MMEREMMADSCSGVRTIGLRVELGGAGSELFFVDLTLGVSILVEVLGFATLREVYAKR